MKVLLLLLIAATSWLAGAPEEIKLWPDGAPGQMQPHSKATEDFIRTKAGKSTITDITEPTITIYRPEKPNGTSVIVAPGGGYVFLSAVHEGAQVCEWLNTIGVTGILLKYRTPTRDEAAPHEKPVQDAAKAIAIVREHAKEWKLDPNRVGLLGFSAGGNLLAHIACDRATKTELPNFGIMIYGGGFVDFKDPTKFKEGFTVPADAPPLFLACAHDDGQNPIASTLLYLEYKKLGIPCELHLFTKGGHGFGMRDNKQPINAWPKRCEEWIEAMGWLPSLTKLNAEIEKRIKALAELDKMPKAMCTDDKVIFEKELEKAWKELHAAKTVKEAEEAAQKVRRMRTEFEEFEAGLEAAGRAILATIEDIKRLRQEVTDLEIERDRLIQLQSKNQQK